MMPEALRARLEKLYQWTDRRSGNLLSLLKGVMQSFGQARGSESAAAMAYYAIFSLFPLLLFLVAAGSAILERQHIFNQVISLITEAIPVSQQLIENNVQQVLNNRGTVGVVSLAGALWSGSSIFSNLTRAVNRAWPSAAPRNLLERRLVGLLMVGVFGVLLIASLLTRTLAGLLPRLHIPLWNSLTAYDSFLWTSLSALLPWLLSLLLFVALYRWLPHTPVPWKAALITAVTVALGWEAVSRGFAWYLHSGLASYELVYGSLGAVIALLFWAYLSSWLVLFGAHLAAALGKRQQKVAMKASEN
jgi:membrane protein